MIGAIAPEAIVSPVRERLPQNFIDVIDASTRGARDARQDKVGQRQPA
jgi:hypothetical protein